MPEATEARRMMERVVDTWIRMIMVMVRSSIVDNSHHGDAREIPVLGDTVGD